MFKNLFKLPDIQELKKSGDEKQLIKLLGHKDPDLRAQAARALGQLRSQSALAYLVRSLVDPDAGVRQAGVEALTALSWQPASAEEKVVWILARNRPEEFSKLTDSDIPLLLQAFQFKGLQINSVLALGYVWNKTVIDVLPKAMCGDNPELNQAIEKTLVRIGEPALNRLKELVKPGREKFVDDYCLERRAEFTSGGQIRPMLPTTTWTMMANQTFSLAKRIIYLIENHSWPEGFILAEANKLAAGIGKTDKDGTFHHLIAAESGLPCQEKYTYTLKPKEDFLEFEISQGDAFMARSNWPIGRFKISRLQQNTEKKTEIEVTFRVSADAGLSLEAKDPKTNQQLSVSKVD